MSGSNTQRVKRQKPASPSERLPSRVQTLLPKMWRAVAGVVRPFLPNIKQWFGGVVVAALAWAAFLISPLKDIMFDVLYPENLSVEVESDLAVIEGSSFEIPVIVLARGFRGISSGVVTVAVENTGGSDIVVMNERTIDVEKSDDATAKVVLKGVAKKPGHAVVRVGFSNQKSAQGVVHTGEINVTVGLSDGVIESNFSGTWNLKLMDDLGEMVITDNRGKIGGQVIVSVTPTTRVDYLISAKRDGSSFFGTLWQEGSPHKRILVDAQWKPVNLSMTVIGSCTWQSFVGDQWKIDSVAEDCFDADAPTRQVS